jgi:hypothetical protein
MRWSHHLPLINEKTNDAIELAQWLQNDYSFLRVFNYLTFRAVMATSPRW